MRTTRTATVRRSMEYTLVTRLGIHNRAVEA